MRLPGWLRRSEKGITMIEVAVSVALIGLVSLGASMTNAQLLVQTSRNNDFTTASRQTLNALHWISQDVQMAQTVTPGPTGGFPLTLQWEEWDNTVHQVVYSLEDNRLTRSWTIDGSAAVNTLVAEYINEETEMTNCSYDDGILTVTITGSVGTGDKTVNVTKIREITCRPKL